MKKHLIWLVAALAVLMSTLAYAQKVTVDWDHNVHNFSDFKTYTWSRPARPASSPLMDQRIVAAIENQLNAKGLQKVQGPADLRVTYNAGVRRERSATAFGSGRLRVGGGMTTVNENTSNIGTLVVDIENANTRQLLWRGMASDTLSDKPDKNSQKIEKAVTKMFKKYPPPTK